MPNFKQGSTGPQIKSLQKNLKDLGFDCGPVDGIFGIKTKKALTAFQKSRGLRADGIASKKTIAALELRDTSESSSIIPAVTVIMVSTMFPFTPQENIKNNPPYILNALNKENLTDKPLVLCALATIRAETESFEAISEFISRFNTSPGGCPFDLYDYRRDLGNMGPPDGERYRGREFIQLTGRKNYRVYGEEAGLDN